MSYITRTGQVLLNPSEKAGKYARELKENKRYTNDMHCKKDKNGKSIKLTKEQRAFRAGYLTHSSDSNKAFNSNHPNYKRKTKI